MLPTAAALDALASTVAAFGPISGPGLISVLVDPAKDITFSSGTPAQAIGCLNAAGQVVLDDCATFTAVANTAEGEYSVATARGECSFENPDAPLNTDSVYGDNVHALDCSAGNQDSLQFYTLSGVKYNFLGQGDANLYYDIPGLPRSSTDALDIWYYTWGSSQKTVPEGHYKALLLWEPTS